MDKRDNFTKKRKNDYEILSDDGIQQMCSKYNAHSSRYNEDKDSKNRSSRHSPENKSRKPSRKRLRVIYLSPSSDEENTPAVKTTKQKDTLTKIHQELSPRRIFHKTDSKVSKGVKQTVPDGTPIEYIKSGDIKYLKAELKPKSSSNYKTKSTASHSNIKHLWEDYEILQQEFDIQRSTAQNIVQLIKEGNTIPFIARYRKSEVDFMSADTLRDVKERYVEVAELQKKVVTAYQKITAMGKMTPSLQKCLLSVKSLEAFEETYAPFKPVNGEASIKRQIHITLEEPAESILQGNLVFYSKYIGKVKGLDDTKSVQKHVIAVMAKKISTNTSCLEFIQQMRRESHCTLKTKKINKRNTTSSTETVRGKSRTKKEASNFEDYFDKCYPTSILKPHQIMAINRAEHLKYINVTLIFNDFSKPFYHEARKQFSIASRGKTADIFEDAATECYNNIVIPLLKRMKRAELKSFAEKASLSIFNKNLKQMLLAPPVKRGKILGVDPGFGHGCKLGVISRKGEVLATSIVYPHRNWEGSKLAEQERIFRDLLLEHGCALIALGNGTACRETESWITDMISRDFFKPLKVSYTIVNESGASIYSCSKEAIKEFDDLDPNLISAVSLARRIQDPLSELVKVEPKHLGIGMYQHDINQKRLEETLIEVVSECVSFVGVDVNTASQCLLRHVAGLSEKRADEIIAQRPFKTRDQLLKVKGLGPLTFKQCAGFLKIIGGDNKLDGTIVHPESYHIAGRIIKHLRLRDDNIGTVDFIKSMKKAEEGLLSSAESFGTTRDKLAVILEGLSKPLGYDLREDGYKMPIFREGVTKMESLTKGMTLTGAVNNCTSFGSFVDIGVRVDGLLHVSNARGVALQVGDRVEIKIVNVDIDRKRIGLELVRML